MNARTLVTDAVKRITIAMEEGLFTREDLEAIKRVFQKGIELTDKTLAKGPVQDGGES